MRLICPNCDAEYEIDDAAIPADGRDVQCSNCGHAWFQTHPEIEAEQEAEADLYEAPAGAVAAEPVAAEEGAEPMADAVPQAAAVKAPVARSLDETVLAVLREEAEREAAARRAEAAPKPVIESQTEMPLVQDQGGMAAAVRRIAKLRAAAEAETAAPPPAPTPAPAPAKSRSQMLPAIEEINSTLRATNSRTSDEDSAIVGSMVEAKASGVGFRKGFLTLVVLAVLIVVLYAMAPVIKTQVPALAGSMDAYVATVNSARIALDAGLMSLVATLRGLAGGQGG